METSVAVLVVAIWLAFIVLGPLLVLWALNVLFHLGIAYTIKTWVATLILEGLLVVRVKTKT